MDTRWWRRSASAAWLVELGLTEVGFQSDPDEHGANNPAECLFGTDPFKGSAVPVTLNDQSAVSIHAWSGEEVDVSLEEFSNLEHWRSHRMQDYRALSPL